VFQTLQVSDVRTHVGKNDWHLIAEQVQTGSSLENLRLERLKEKKDGILLNAQ